MKEIEMKQQVLKMLEQFLLGENGKKFAPKEMSVEVATVEPSEDLEEVLDRAAEESPADKMADKENAAKAGVSEDEWEDSEEDEEADEKMPKKMSLQEFLACK